MSEAERGGEDGEHNITYGLQNGRGRILFPSLRSCLFLFLFSFFFFFYTVDISIDRKKRDANVHFVRDAGKTNRQLENARDSPVICWKRRRPELLLIHGSSERGPIIIFLPLHALFLVCILSPLCISSKPGLTSLHTTDTASEFGPRY